MLARATLRPECKHPKSQKPQRTPKLQIHHITCMQCSLLFLPIKGYTVFCCKYQPHLQYMQKIRMQVFMFLIFKPQMCQR